MSTCGGCCAFWAPPVATLRFICFQLSLWDMHNEPRHQTSNSGLREGGITFPLLPAPYVYLPPFRKYGFPEDGTEFTVGATGVDACGSAFTCSR